MTHSYHPASSPPPTEPPSSTALLALKRFARTSLKRAALLLCSLMVLLVMEGHAAAHPDVLSESLSRSGLQEARLPVSSLTLPANSQTGNLRDSLGRLRDRTALSPIPEHLYLLEANLTHHHLTGARLAIPTAQQTAAQQTAAQLTKQHSPASAQVS